MREKKHKTKCRNVSAKVMLIIIINAKAKLFTLKENGKL